MHDHERVEVPQRVRRLLLLAVVPFAVATVAGLVLLWPSDPPTGSEVLGPPAELYDGRVTEVVERPCLGDTEARCFDVVVRLSQGPDQGEQVAVEVGQGTQAPRLREGAPVVLGRAPGAESTADYYFADHQRDRPLLLLGALFAVAVVVLGRWRGLAALGALAVSLLVIVFFVLPAILDGRSPLAVAVVGAAAVMFVALYLTHGVTAQTTTAVLGTLVSLALTAVLAAVFVGASRFTGLASEEANFLQAAAGQVNVRGLLLGGIVIGSLGVLDDVTVTQASAVWQLHRADPSQSARALYRSALRIGRDHIGSTVNTLVLAYAGASLPLLLLFTLSSQPVGAVVTGEVVAQEVVRTLVGSVGLIASVPVTTALAAAVVSQARPVEVDPWAEWEEPPEEPKKRPRRDKRREKRAEPGWEPPKAERDFWGDLADE
ncbi:MAG TPA: YibE/F family protein [Acidimicrobiales bacterium]|nr:YibE/F family protein [Acidimicrobiales bacterium]